MNKDILRRALIGFVSGIPICAFALEDLTAELPDAKAGECYAKVLFPARYKTEQSTVVVKEASESVEIEPARYEWVRKLVRVSDAGSELKELPAQFGTETVSYQVAPASTQWVMGSVDSDIPANPDMLMVARDGGADIDNAVPGQCFDEHYTPATYRTVKERMLIAEAVEEITVQPAEYEWVEEQVMVAPASIELVVVPAVFDTVSEKVKIEDAKKIWRPGPGDIEKIDYASGEIMHLVDVPAVYKTVSKRVLKTPARTEFTEQPARYETVRVRKLVSDASMQKRTIPAKYQDVARTELASAAEHKWRESVDNSVAPAELTGIRICLQETPEKMASVEKTVVAAPPTVKRIEFPARYDSQRVRELVKDAREIRSPLPEKTETFNRRVKIADQRLEWRPILCEQDITSGLVKQVQQSLRVAGFSPGQIDGLLGYRTMTAIEQYQKDKGLATGGLTYDTLRQLGITFERR